MLAAVGRGRRLDLAFAEAAHGLDDRERAFAREVAYGVVRLRGRLDHRLAARVRGGLERLDAPVLDALRMGAYQLTEMSGVPAYAAVSESVALARSAAGRGAAGLVNAVLRALARGVQDGEAFPDRDADPLGWASTWGSHPRWLVERWAERWGAAAALALVEANNAVPPLTLRPLGDVAAARRALEAAGAQVD
ncbi:MAG: SAM-dependent methyltransferase, partial [Gemmatimonadetes bacterium]